MWQSFVFIVVGFDAECGQSAKDSQAGLEDKSIFGRYQQAQEYLQWAESTHKTIQVCCLILSWRSVELNGFIFPQQLIWGLY